MRAALTVKPTPTPANAPANAHPNGPLLILWGSQTGTAEDFASTLAREARQGGYHARSVDLEDYEMEDLAWEEGPVLFLMATHGEGDPTDNAVSFYEWANAAERQVGEILDEAARKGTLSHAENRAVATPDGRRTTLLVYLVERAARAAQPRAAAALQPSGGTCEVNANAQRPSSPLPSNDKSTSRSSCCRRPRKGGCSTVLDSCAAASGMARSARLAKASSCSWAPKASACTA